MIEFPSQIYIEQIREHLWRGDSGRAAVMVGAGFSRNAEKMSSRIPDFPLLKEIAEQAFDALYPKGSLDEEQRQRSKIIMTSGVPLRLMSEYEAAFTRPTLDDLLINTIPDNAYRPGDIHSDAAQQ